MVSESKGEGQGMQDERKISTGNEKAFLQNRIFFLQILRFAHYFLNGNFNQNKPFLNL
jgi:hypothetical protein